MPRLILNICSTQPGARIARRRRCQRRTQAHAAPRCCAAVTLRRITPRQATPALVLRAGAARKAPTHAASARLRYGGGSAAAFDAFMSPRRFHASAIAPGDSRAASRMSFSSLEGSGAAVTVRRHHFHAENLKGCWRRACQR